MCAAIVKGALEQHASLPALRRRVEFQLNPERLARSQSPHSDSRGVSETIRLELLLHFAAEPLPARPESGIYPQLAALEELLEAQANPPQGNLFQQVFGGAPWLFLSFQWGERQVPVRIESLQIEEQLFNAALTPIMASVDLRLRTLSRREVADRPQARTMLNAYLAKRAAASQQRG